MENKDVIYETEYWKIILYHNQSYLGTCVIDLKRDCGEMSKLTVKEWMDLYENVVKKLEVAVKRAFGATMFNWDCLMNGAYKSSKPKPLVHLHIFPRYNHKVDFEGKVFDDLKFGSGTKMSDEGIVLEGMKLKIIDEIKKHL